MGFKAVLTGAVCVWIAAAPLYAAKIGWVIAERDRRTTELNRSVIGGREATLESIKTRVEAADYYVMCGEYDRARKEYGQVLANCRKVLSNLEGKPPADILVQMAAAHAGHATIALEQTRWIDAEGHFRRAISVARMALPLEAGLSQYVLTGRAICLASVAEKKEQMGLLEEVLESVVRMHGKEHTLTALVYTQMAMCQHEFSDFKGAEKYFEKALKIYRNVLKPDDPKLADVLSRLASVEVERGKRRGVRAKLEEAHAIRQEAFGVNHPKEKRARENLAAFDDLET